LLITALLASLFGRGCETSRPLLFSLYHAQEEPDYAQTNYMV